jgi:outer membrane protein OmpA-like peptidoglycan-associated protein
MKMKRVFLVSVVFFAMQTTFAQEKGLHLTLGGGLGRTSFAYDLEGGSYKGGIGYGGTLGVQYFFNYNWGLSLAGEYFLYKTQSRYDRYEPFDCRMFDFNNQVDDEGDAYMLRLRLLSWQENQKTHFVEIPFMGVYQNKFGKKESAGFYFALGVKAQIPVSSSFERFKGVIQSSGLYTEGEKKNLWLGEPGQSSLDYDHHGFGKNTFKTEEERTWNGNSGKNNLKVGLSAVAEFGFLFSMSRRVDLSLGVVADYGLTNISKRNDQLLTPKSGVTQQAGNYVAENVDYTGILNSEQTPKIIPFSIRGKIGIRIKIGALKELTDENENKSGDPSNSRRSPDTIFVYPVIVYLPPSDSLNPQGATSAYGGYPAGAVPYNANNPYNGGGNNPNNYRNPNYGGNQYNSGNPYNPYGNSSPYSGVNSGIAQEDRGLLDEPIYFDLDKSTLKQKSVEVLNRKIEQLKKYPYAVVTLVGHTCDIGTENHNNSLSYNRADAVRQYLIQRGIEPQRIHVQPMGPRNPTYPNDSEQNRALNRRVDFLF